MNVRLVPGNLGLPVSGGVRQHCLMLRRHIAPLVELTDDPQAFTHVQSTYLAPRCDVFTCHGGFYPAPPIPAVVANLHKAKRIISVAKWIVDVYFPDLAHKTVVIPNGVCLADWDAVPEGKSGYTPGYVLVKAYHAWPEHCRMICDVIERMPQQHFIVIGNPHGVGMPSLKNMSILSVPVAEEHMARIIRDCGAFVSPSSEVNPVMALEAMACSKAVFGLDMHGNREVIMPYARYADADGLVKLLRDPALRSGVENHKLVGYQHDWRKLANDTLAVYEAAGG